MSQVTATLPRASVSTVTSGIPSPSQYWGSANGARIISGALSMPLYGAWVADLVIESTATLASPVSLTIGNLTLSGTVYQQAVFAGRLEVRIVAGAGGWSKTVEPRGYNQPSGVLRSQVLADAATEVGERTVVATDGTIGTGYARIGDKAGRVLRALAGSQWWIDSAGVTHVGPRPVATVASPFILEMLSGASGVVTIATEDPASWLPGVSFSSATIETQTIASVRHVFRDDGHARLEVMVSANDPWSEGVKELVRQEVSASVPYAQSYEYVVTSATSTSVDALPADPARGVPPLTGVPYRSGVPGGSAVLSPGTHVAFGFLDGNPGNPVLLGVFDGTTPLTATIGVQASLTLGDESALPIVPAPWGAALATDLTVFAAAMAAAATGPLAPMAAPATALQAALAALPPGATTKVRAT